MRIEEKFKDYRHAFRSFDKNYNGTLSFKEFMNGLENIGVRMSLEDFRTIYETIDYTNTGDIDFNKFCLLNTDRSLDIYAMIHALKHREDINMGSRASDSSKKPPLPINMNNMKMKPRVVQSQANVIPKNKDYNRFNSDVQELSHNEFCKKKRRDLNLPSKANDTFTYGLKHQ